MGNTKRIFLVMATLLATIVGGSNVVSANSGGTIPAPPESGPQVEGNFYINGYTPKQNANYRNMQTVSDGTASVMETMWYKNPVNIKRPFQTKFYIYMDGTADGLTFTLQGQGPNAKGFAGEALGAYGNVRDEHNNYGGYIKNALSLEFDTYLNYDYSDTDYNKQYTQENGDHLAYIHPDESMPFTWTDLYTHLKLKHYNFFHTDLDDKKWHQVVVTWQPNLTNQTGTISTEFDGAEVGDHTVPLSRFGNSDVYWGFTGSTGAEQMLGAVAYTQVIQQPTLEKQVRNLTKGETAFTDHTDAEAGDELEFKFTVANSKVNGIGNTWQDVSIKDALPEGLLAEDGNQTIKIPVGDVGVDGTVTKTVKVRVDKNEDTTLINTAEATGSNYYVNPVTLPSNDVRVNVKKTEFTKPVKLTMTDQIVDETYPDSHNATQTEVDDVAGGDKIDYTITVANTAAQSKFTGGKLTFDVPKDATINSLVVNDMPVPAGWYENKATANGQQIGITDIDLISGDTLAIKVNLTLPKKVTFDRYTTTPKIVGNDTDQSAYTATGDPLTMVVADDTISFTPQDINFGEHPTLQAGMVLDRTAETTAPNAVVNISDERRTKTPVSVTVKAVEPFREIDNSTAQLPAHLLFYHGSAADAVTQGVEIAKTTDGQTLTDVVWQQNEGLRLHVDGSTNQPGEYRTQLEWQVNMGY